jgi:predicted AAA+ superfamily ATPase
MKQLISQLIDDFHERKLPELLDRDQKLPELKGKASVVIGMRRTGKTFFCFQRIRKLLSSGTPVNQILYLNFEDDRLLDFSVKDFQAILDVYFGKFPMSRNVKCHFFFDEIQRIDQWEVFIRRLLDTENVQVCLTGSSSKLLSTEIATSLRGRSMTTEIFPFSFKEFIKQHGLLEKIPESFGSNVSSILRKAVSDYLETGGFPEIQTVEKNMRGEILQGYIGSVLLKDVVERHRIGSIIVLKHLVNSIMNSSCSQFSVNKFYNTLRSMSIKCTKNNIYEYLDHLLDAYLFYRVPLHTRSAKARIVNPAKIYVIDTGLLNTMTFRNSANRGHLLENMVFMHLRRNGFEVEYVVSDKGYETDFLARHSVTGEVMLLQVCWDISNDDTFVRELRGLKTAMSELGIDKGEIITWDDEKTLDGNISVIPVWKWLLN